MTQTDQTQDVVTLPNGKTIEKQILKNVRVILEAMEPSFSSRFGEIFLCAKSSTPLTPMLQSWFNKYQLCHPSGVLKEPAKMAVQLLLKREENSFVIRQYSNID